MSTAKKTKAAPQAAVPAVEAVAETYEQVVETATEQAEQVGAAVTQGYDDFAALQKEGFEALVRAGEILARGAEALGKEYFAFAQDAAETNGEVAKALLAAKSVQEVFELQSEFVRVTMDKSVDESGKLSEMSLKIASDAFEPLQKQMTAAVEAGIKPLAV